MELAVGLPCAKRMVSEISMLNIISLSLPRSCPMWSDPKGVVAGTQCIDRMWASLDKFIPPELSNKSGKGGTVNEKIFTYLYAWVWRYHLPTKANFKVELAKICWQSSLPAVPRKGAAKSTCRNTIALKSNKHKLSLKTHGLLPTRDLVVVVVVVVVDSGANR